jgi:hypothetical protein
MTRLILILPHNTPKLQGNTVILPLNTATLLPQCQILASYAVTPDIDRTYAVTPDIALMVRYAALTHPTNRGIA